MPRQKKISDACVLDAALTVMHSQGPDALTFAALAEACGLSSATLVQRFASKPNLVRQALQHAWDKLISQTQSLAALTPRTPIGAIDLLVRLSAQYGDIEEYAQGILLLREDLHDPALRARGAEWKVGLCRVLDECFAGSIDSPPDGIGLLLAAQWQGALLWWALDPKVPVETYVKDGLNWFVRSLSHAAGDFSTMPHVAERGSFA